MKFVRNFGVALSIFVLICLFWLKIPWWICEYLTGNEAVTFEQAGQVGDLFGSVNALFTGLGLSGALISIYFQGRQLSLQGEKIKRAREGVKEQEGFARITALVGVMPVMLEEARVDFRTALKEFYQCPPSDVLALNEDGWLKFTLSMEVPDEDQFRHQVAATHSPHYRYDLTGMDQFLANLSYLKSKALRLSVIKGQWEEIYTTLVSKKGTAAEALERVSRDL